MYHYIFTSITIISLHSVFKQSNYHHDSPECNQHAKMQHVKPNTNNQTLYRVVLPMKGYQKKYNVQSKLKTQLGKDCEVEKVMRYIKDIEVFEEI